MDIVRFFQKTTGSPESDSCWLWLGAKLRIQDNGNGGYGTFWWDGKKSCAHRFAWEAFVGSIPSGKEIDHLCRNRACVNPWHLEPVTRRENLRRGNTFVAQNLAKTACIRGHEYTPETTAIYRGFRVCKVCANAYQRGMHRVRHRTRRR